ncbi:MAG: 6-phosphogluconolactonase [Rhodobacteraceae bacterium]|nr:6-phosphogluconolactonase [Paracoccaceae bacterium]
MKIVEYADRDLLAIGLARGLAGALENALFTHDTVTLAVPGGTTPGPVFDALCAADLEWSRVTVMATDERLVPPDDARSNARLIRSRLLTGRAAQARFLAFWDAGDDVAARDAVLARRAEDLAARLPVSVLLVGMGADMHTASLFPGSPDLARALSAQAPVLMAVEAPGAPEPRATLSAAVLNGAMDKHMVIFGTEKRAALERAAQLPPETAPVAAILQDMTIHWTD